jgi:hypothetical protein
MRWDDKEKEHLIDFSQKNGLYIAAYPTRKVRKYLPLVFKGKNGSCCFVKPRRNRYLGYSSRIGMLLRLILIS